MDILVVYLDGSWVSYMSAMGLPWVSGDGSWVAVIHGFLVIVHG